MYLACNYSKELKELIDTGEVNVDYVKIGFFEDYEENIADVKSIGPILIHGLGLDERTSKELSRKIEWEELNNKLAEFNLPHLGVHFAGLEQDFEVKICRKDYIDKAIKECKNWASNLEIPFLIENTLYSPHYAKKGVIKYSSEPEVISEVCEKTEIGMILDTAHAKVSAWSRNENIYDYLQKLPLNRVKEIHVVGNLFCEKTGLRDKHVEMENEDYEILEWLLSRTSPHVVTLEYGRNDKVALKKQLNKISHIINGD